MTFRENLRAALHRHDERSRPPKAAAPSVDQASAAGTHSPAPVSGPVLHSRPGPDQREGSVSEDIPPVSREIPVTVEQRAFFIQRRSSAYVDALVRHRALPFPALLWKRAGRLIVFPSERQIANRLAVEDLGALLGRGSPLAHVVQIATERVEALDGRYR